MARNGNGNASADSRRRRARRNLRQRNAQAANGNGNGNGHGLPGWVKVIIALGAIGFIGMLFAAAIAIAVYRSYADDLVAPDELAINQPSYGARVLDRTGQLLYEYVDDRSGLRRPVKLENVSEAFLAATIATEDDSYYTNPGVNIKGLMRAAWENLSPLSDTPGVLDGSGGSSITQQLVKNVYIPEEERQKRSVTRKIKETVYALELTQRYDKERILQWYVNQISYGGVYNGVEAAAQGYFAKSARDLTLAEAALLAGIPQSPAAYDPVNHPEASTERRNEILDILQHKGRVRIGKDRYYDVNLEELAAARETPIDISVKRFPIEAPHFVLQYVQPQLELLVGHDALYRDGLVVTTTLDLNLEHESNRILENWIQQFENVSDSRNGSVLVMEPKTGEILAMVGSRDYFREDIEGKNNNVTACNSPGSSFKPFSYITAFLNLGWGPGTMILDTPVSYAQPDGSEFVPTNPAKNFSGPVTVRYALGNSLNIPAVKTAAAVGADRVVAQARRMGFMQTFRLKGEGGCSGGSYGPAIATGGVDVTLEEMVFGYTVMANGGVMVGQAPLDPGGRRASERQIDPIAILKITDAQGRVRFDIEKSRKQERVVKEEYPYLISNILSDSSAQCATFGCGGISVPGRQAAVKTGTSEPFDAKGPSAGKIGETWAFAYTPDYVVGIWAGNSNNAPIVNIFSTSISYRSARDVLVATYAGRPGTSFSRPEGVVDGSVCVPSGLKPSPLCGKTTTDLFVKENLPDKEDDWWQRVRLDLRNGLLAGPGTPPPFVEEKVILVPPADLTKSEEDKKRMSEWAQALGLPLAPTETSDATNLPAGAAANLDLPAIIFSPTAGQTISGRFIVTGRAASDKFESFRLEYGKGIAPTTWTRINQSSDPMPSGPLGLWDTDAAGPGIYTIRLVVDDRQRGRLTATVTVTVGQVGPDANRTASPTPTPKPPLTP